MDMVAGLYVSRPPCFLTPADAPAKPRRSFRRLIRRFRARIAHGQSRRAIARWAAQAWRAAPDVEAMDLLPPRIQQSPPPSVGRQLHRIVLPRRGDGARRRSPALL